METSDRPDPLTRDRVLELRGEAMSINEIADMYGRAPAEVRKILEG